MELDPSREDAYINLAVSSLKVYEYEDAVKTLKKLCRSHPNRRWDNTTWARPMTG